MRPLDELIPTAWLNWLRVTKLDLYKKGWAEDPRNLLFDKLTGQKESDFKYRVTPEQEQRIRLMAGDHGLTYTAALYAAHKD